MSLFRVRAPSGHAELDVSVTVPGSGSRSIVLEVGMRQGESAPVLYIARRELTVSAP